MTAFVLSTRAFATRVRNRVSEGRLVDQFGLASGFASLSACGRLGLRRATLYHCAAKDDFPAPATITAWHDSELDIGLCHD
jgi:hypothetical protein